MQTKNFISEQQYLIHLIASILRGDQPAEKPEELSFEKIFKIAKFHSVANIAFYAVEKLEVKPDGELMKQWAEIRDKAIYKDIIQCTEFESICKSFEKQKLEYLPLKGILIKKLYPQSDMRMMSDIDILIKEKDAPAAKEIMQELGYSVEYYDLKNDDVYFKEPVMNVELHKRLFDSQYTDLVKMYRSPWEYAESKDGLRYEFELNYFFVYILAHTAKHYRVGGTGIKSIMDVWVLYNEYKNVLDLSCIDKILDEDLAALCHRFIGLAEEWFGDSEISEEYKDMSDYILGSGTYGTLDNMIHNQLQKQGKVKFFFKRLFLPYSLMVTSFPILKKAPILLPFFWIARPFIRIFTKREAVKANISALFSKSK